MNKLLNMFNALLKNNDDVLNINDIVSSNDEIYKIEDIFVSGSYNVYSEIKTASTDTPIYKCRKMNYDYGINDYVPSDIIELKYYEELSNIVNVKNEPEVYSFDTCTFFKDDSGNLYVYGIYSSHYIDSQKDILTGEAHTYFAELVNKGAVPYPDLYIAHITVPVGKCQMIDYHDDGFAVFGALVHPEWKDSVEEIIVKSIEQNMQLGLSHGFNQNTVVYDVDGHIIKYISHEVSILPLFPEIYNGVKTISASNKYTALLSSEV